MLGNFLKINGVTIPNPNPGTFTEAYPPQENIFTTEAGTQLSSVVRLDRYTWSGEFNVSSRLKAILLLYATRASVVCTVNGTDHRGRLRVGDISLYANSEWTKNTNGLWTMSLTFEGF